MSSKIILAITVEQRALLLRCAGARAKVTTWSCYRTYGALAMRGFMKKTANSIIKLTPTGRHLAAALKPTKGKSRDSVRPLHTRRGLADGDTHTQPPPRHAASGAAAPTRTHAMTAAGGCV